MRWELVFSFLLFFEIDDFRSVLVDDLLILLTFLSPSSDSSSDLEEEEDLVRSAFFASSPLDFFDLLSPVVPVLLALALPLPLLVLLVDPLPLLSLPEPFEPLDDDDDPLPPLPLPPCRASRMGICSESDRSKMLCCATITSSSAVLLAMVVVLLASSRLKALARLPTAPNAGAAEVPSAITDMGPRRNTAQDMPATANRAEDLILTLIWG